MIAKRVIPRRLANADVDTAFEHYLTEGGPDATDVFMDALAAAYVHISRHPGTGSPRYAVKLNIGGLRFWALGNYPYLVFYFEMPDHIDVVRVLHGAMDISMILDMGSDGNRVVREPAPSYDLIAEWS